ncbi:glycerol-3-phosphate 1-O-acyltransferase PlsY [Pacificimonas flava]|uniref:Glycerol-3-phosphate acyltransferase n=1 Tax=Pacificimonas flava TaxID=1234595 RepID=M2U6X1_9SPHN|nr:glycerol-3-phosphate 1-O-acyltransferase PlsY [Pacificimonas flava]EMD83743.1 Acyl-phosphate:glycerol-3-phosphate O-acyltransferase PlsY [Pacificimonas flava]MBB5280577.1 glycerol-3-phosphate acyltransferase PlsY [Pacificimonas flava]
MGTDFLSLPWFWLIAGYILGSIPFGLIVTALVGKGDVRKVGSGNIGTTNVLRAGGKGAAAATLILDAGKGALAVWLGGRYAMGGDILGGIGAFVGHCFPIFLMFRGGKGVATYLGIALALQPLAGLAFAVVWLLTAALFRYSSLAGLAASIAAPLVPLAMGRWDAALLLAGMAAMVIAKHEDNIGRLMRGEESRLGRKPADSPAHRSGDDDEDEWDRPGADGDDLRPAERAGDYGGPRLRG